MGLGEKLNIQKLKLDISGIETQKTADFVALGKYYFSRLSSEEIPEQLKEVVEAVRSKDAQIAEKQAQIAELERIIEEQQAAKNAAAQASQSARQQTQNSETVPKAAFCMRCGSRLNEEMSFCPGCGAKITNGSEDK